MQKQTAETIKSVDYGYLINEIAHILTLSMNSVLKSLGLTFPRFRIICFLCEHPDIEVCQRDLEILLCIRASSISSLVEKLLENGHVTTSRSGKFTRLHITDKGKSVYKLLGDKKNEVDEILLSGMTNEQRSSLLSLLTILKMNLVNIQ